MQNVQREIFAFLWSGLTSAATGDSGAHGVPALPDSRSPIPSLRSEARGEGKGEVQLIKRFRVLTLPLSSTRVAAREIN